MLPRRMTREEVQAVIDDANGPLVKYISPAGETIIGRVIIDRGGKTLVIAWGRRCSEQGYENYASVPKSKTVRC